MNLGAHPDPLLLTATAVAWVYALAVGLKFFRR